MAAEDCCYLILLPCTGMNIKYIILILILILILNFFLLFLFIVIIYRANLNSVPPVRRIATTIQDGNVIMNTPGRQR
jgi:hypothetical protein